MKKHSIFAIDPSNTSCGWAVIDLHTNKKAAYRCSGDISFNAKHKKEFLDSWAEAGHVQGNLNKPPHDANAWLNKNLFMLQKLANEFYDAGLYRDDRDFPQVATVVIELPWGANEANVKDIMKLMMLVGQVFEHFQNYGCEVILAPVMSWKGQTKKEMTLRRINRRWDLDLQTKDFDEADAIGIATWYACDILGYKAI